MRYRPRPANTSLARQRNLKLFVTSFTRQLDERVERQLATIDAELLEHIIDYRS